MTIQERKQLAKKPIIWKGNLADDCSSNWAGLLLRAEWMDEHSWWWAVYDMQNEEVTIDYSNNYSDNFFNGDIARKKAEEVAEKYIFEITNRQETAKYRIFDTFKIHDRGIVFLGHKRKGIISIGDTIEFTAFNMLLRRKISGIDAGYTAEKGNKYRGILIECMDETEIEELRNWEPNNMVATVYKGDWTNIKFEKVNFTFIKPKEKWWKKFFGLKLK